MKTLRPGTARRAPKKDCSFDGNLRPLGKSLFCHSEQPRSFVSNLAFAGTYEILRSRRSLKMTS